MTAPVADRHELFDDCLACLTPGVEAGDTAEPLLHAALQQAQRVMSPHGVDVYLQGLCALSRLGKGAELLQSYLEHMPDVARAVGEDVQADVVESLMMLASLTSGAVLTRVLSRLPLAANRLGDAELLRAYLRLLHQLASRAPRGLRPMLESLDELLSRLTLGGLRRWALWGAETYQRDFDGQGEYFALRSETSKSILQRERSGRLFVDYQRQLNYYLRALWGRAFALRPGAGDLQDDAAARPYIEDYQVYLPDAIDNWHGIDGVDAYRAAVAHAAAHLAYTSEGLYLERLDAWQLACVDLFEDARVEYLAYRRFPGLARLWLRFFDSAREQVSTLLDPHLSSLLQLGYALLSRRYAGQPEWIAELARDYNAALEQDANDAALALDFGLRCHAQLGRAGRLPPASLLGSWPIPYRDDNRFFHAFDSAAAVVDVEQLSWLQPTLRRQVGLMEMVNEIDSELVDDSPQEVWVLPTELFPYEDQGVSYNASEGGPPLAPPCHYDEWDYRVQLARPHWTTLVEQRPPRGDPTRMDRILETYKPVANRMRHLIDRLQPRGLVRERGCEEGDQLDIDAAVDAMIDLRRGVLPDTRVNIRVTHHRRDLSLLVLMDLSASTNDPVARVGGEDGEPFTLLDLTRESCGLLAWAVDSIGDRFAVHGFASDGRNDVRYYRLKDFDQAYDEAARARLAGISGGLSTRMGTALRHAGRQLLQQPSRKRLVLLITDGEPADIDERDPRYLREDCRHAVNELAAQGVHSFCLTLDPLADSYVQHIFGARNYSIVDNVAALPERLPRVFSALTGA